VNGKSEYFIISNDRFIHSKVFKSVIIGKSFCIYFEVLSNQEIFNSIGSNTNNNRFKYPTCLKILTI
jgi:hypothetical protein